MQTIGIIGAGGHCKVVIDIINEMGIYKIVGIYDDHKQGNVSNIKIIGTLNDIKDAWYIDWWIIAIGNDQVRNILDESYHNLHWCILIHPRSTVSKSAQIGPGSVICAGAVIQPDVRIGRHCIINTNCNIDHEATIANYCSICPGVTICGQVSIGEKTFVGANSTVIQNINIGNNCVIGAGTVIIRNVDNNLKLVGNPAKILKLNI